MKTPASFSLLKLFRRSLLRSSPSQHKPPALSTLLPLKPFALQNPSHISSLFIHRLTFLSAAPDFWAFSTAKPRSLTTSSGSSQDNEEDECMPPHSPFY